MRDNYVNVRFWFMLHANVFILHVDKNKSHVVINKSHANLILLHIDIVYNYPSIKWQKYVTIQSYKCYIYTFLRIMTWPCVKNPSTFLQHWVKHISLEAFRVMERLQEFTIIAENRPAKDDQGFQRHRYKCLMFNDLHHSFKNWNSV